MNEMHKLIVMLSKANIPFEVYPFTMFNVDTHEHESTFLVASPNEKNRVVDAVSHCYSYGGKNGLLEVLGSANIDKDNYDVAGWLTAEEAFEYFKAHD